MSLPGFSSFEDLHNAYATWKIPVACILSGLSLGLQVYQRRQHKVLEDLKDVANKSDEF